MAVMDVLLAGAREIAARSLMELQARQEDAGDLTSTVVPSPSPTTSASSDVTSVVSTSNPGNGPPEDGRGDRGDNGTTSPLLFFVALGFGVVFTNLWIIVGVKYCFRYNARNRQMRMAEEGDPVALENMPRPHRRRREKKLMSMDEVNEKFPMMKYKNWVAGRAQEGLPTMGGVSAPPSRANSVRSVEGIAPELPSKERSSDDQRPTTSDSAKNKSIEHASSERAKDPTSTTTDSVDGKDGKKDEPTVSAEGGQSSAATAGGDRPHLERVESEDDNDDEHINPALPPECLGTSGDSCAICIELLEDDDDVRGLTCGHAFHAVCLDPWLTSRRACCPLCKADYYTPKPRPAAADANGHAPDNATFAEMGRNNSRLNLPSTPQSAWYNLRGRSHRFLPAGLRLGAPPSPQQTQRMRERRRPDQGRIRPQLPTQSPTTADAVPTEPRSRNPFSFRPTLPRIRLPQMPRLGRNQQADTQGTTPSGTDQTVTPSQLEAGLRPVAAT